jgi:hypothetical protein
LGQQANLIGPSLQKKFMGAPQNKRFIWKYKVLPLWPTCIGERKTTFTKTYGIKMMCYGKHVGEHIGNLMGAHWELKGNIVGKQWELIFFPSFLK